MAGHCDACLVTCEDFRLHRRADGRDLIRDFIAARGCDCDVITRAGGVQDLVRHVEGFDKPLLRDIRTSVERHGAKTIYLINHEDCGAYSNRTFSSRADELARHWHDLRTAGRTLQAAFEGVEIVALLGERVPGTEEDYRLVDAAGAPPA